MINNSAAAQPQLGVSQADIIYEIVVEGGITRMMALFQDVSDVGDIGSIRSARPYFVRIALGYDAVYIHAGGSSDAYGVLYSTQILHYDGVNGSRQDIFFRDAERRKNLGYEHSLLTSGSLISEYLPTYGARLEHEDGFDNGLTFSTDAAPVGGVAAETVKIHFSSSKNDVVNVFCRGRRILRHSVWFRLRRRERRHADQRRQHPRADHRRFQVAGDTEGRMSVDTTGSGSGTFFCGGVCEPSSGHARISTSRTSIRISTGRCCRFIPARRISASFRRATLWTYHNAVIEDAILLDKR
jgi:hypothetical protein